MQTFFNEIHYDNVGGDTAESIEVAGLAGTDLTGWTIALYNGNGSRVYATINLSGTIADQQNGYGTLSFAQAGIQNGAPDGFALVDNTGTVVEFLSYEGVITAADGPANGMVSTDIGVEESSTTPVGFSLQRVGQGTQAEDFTWAAEMANTFGGVNTGQTFDAAAEAIDDAFATDENTAIGTGLSLFDANPTTADTDADDPLTITQVNGLLANVGAQITLASGALLTVNADGTFSYDPNGSFTELPGPASGASNTSFLETFTYELNGDDTATVTITVNGADSDGDSLEGTAGADILFAGADDDVLNGFEDNDTLNGEGGNDRLNGGTGADILNGGTGDDIYQFADASDTINENVGEGTDLVRANISFALAANVENLQLFGAAAINGTGNELDNVISGSGANNIIDAGDGMDTVFGRTGNDIINGEGGNDILNGENGNDTLNGGTGNDTLNGGALSDILNGGDNDDVLNGDTGNDTLNGDVGMDQLNGGDGFDVLNGGDDDDILSGGAQLDQLFGDAGEDEIDGGAGRDIVSGGADADTFVFDAASLAPGITSVTADRVRDFSQTDGDVIDLSAIDAIDGGANDAFTLIADEDFSGTAGELRFEQGGNAFTLIQGDTDGDGTADFAIRLDGVIDLTQADFVGATDGPAMKSIGAFVDGDFLL